MATWMTPRAGQNGSPIVHDHELGDLSDFDVSSPQNGEILIYNSGTGKWENGAEAAGDVVGPGSATDNAVALFDGTSGKLIKNSTAILQADGELRLTTTAAGDGYRATGTNTAKGPTLRLYGTAAVLTLDWEAGAFRFYARDDLSAIEEFGSVSGIVRDRDNANKESSLILSVLSGDSFVTGLEVDGPNQVIDIPTGWTYDINGTPHTHTHASTTGQGTDDHHNEAHTIASHSDTTATGAELETLTDGSDAGALHIHDARYYTETEVDALTWDASDIVSGAFADARISESSVTQHEAAIDHDALTNTHNLTTDIDHDQLTNFAIGKHRIINDSGTSATELWSASKINTELAGKAASSHNHSASEITSGTLAHERGGLEADVSAFDGVVRITGGSTFALGLQTTVGTPGSDSNVATEQAIREALDDKVDLNSGGYWHAREAHQFDMFDGGGSTPATWTPPTSSFLAGWHCNEDEDIWVAAQFQVPDDWNGDTDLFVDVYVEDNAGTVGVGEVNVESCRYKAIDETAFRSQAIGSGNFNLGGTQYELEKVTFTIDHDASSNVVLAGDILVFVVSISSSEIIAVPGQDSHIPMMRLRYKSDLPAEEV